MSEPSSECNFDDSGNCICSNCGELINDEHKQNHSPPRGMPSCLQFATCPKCNHTCCCIREAPEPRPEPPTSDYLDNSV